MRIRSRLVLLVSAVLLPALVVAGLGLLYVYREEQALYRASLRETARALSLALDRDMGRREATLRALAAAPNLAEGNLARFYLHASAVAKDNDAAIILSDLEGRQLLNTRLPPGAKLPPMLPAERENRARYGNEATIFSDLYLPPAGLGPHSFAIQIPVRRDGQVVAFLTMASFASQVQRLLDERTLPEGWHASIIDRAGVVVARSAEPEKFVGKPVRADLGAKIAAEPEGSHDGMTLAGVRGTAFFSRAPHSGWALLVSVPHAELYGPAGRTAVWMAGIGLLLLGLGAAAALAVARRITRPVEALGEAARRLGRSEPVSAQRTGTLELDETSRQLAAAGERLRNGKAELERRVAEAVGSYEQSQRALQQSQKLEALGRLTGGIAHDFNNVLQTLTTSLQALRLAGAGDRGALLAAAQRAVTRGTELARQLMAFGRMQEARTETIDTAPRLEETRHLLRGALTSGIQLDYELAAGVWPVAVDPAQLELALLNLVINARDAMSRGGRIAVGARNETLHEPRADLAAGDYVRISVVDDGEGMSEEVLARALEPFFTTKGVGKGSGMGLPQAYGFARQAGGTLTLESRPGEGTVAALYLPRAAQPPMPRADPAVPEGMPAGAGKVLLVEDDQEVRESMSAALRATGFDVHTAATADEALQRLQRGERYDAVLTDIVMPGRLNGAELAARIRERYAGVGVVVATGYSGRALDLPGVRALAKPFELRQAVEALNAAMRC